MVLETPAIPCGGSVFLRRILHPIGPGEFFSTYWENEPLVIARGVPGYNSDLLRLDDIDHVIGTLEPQYGEIVVAKNEQTAKSEEYTLPNGTIDPVALYRLFEDGSSIVLSGMQRRIPTLMDLCRSLELEFSAPCQTNIYLTPPDAQGFRTHYDTHDVFIIQVAGSKHWRIYDSPVALPLAGQGFEQCTVGPGPVTQEFLLAAGDVAYIPRGFFHDAVSENSTSLHITLGIHVYTWAEFIIEAVAEVFLRDAQFRHALPVGFAHTSTDRGAVARGLREWLEQLAGMVDPESAVDAFADEFARTRIPQLRHQLRAVLEAGFITAQSVVELRPHLLFHIRSDDEGVTLRYFNSEIRFPAVARDALEFILGGRRAVISALPGILDDAGKITLVRRLQREGLVLIS